MGKVVIQMTMSLDGYVAPTDKTPDHRHQSEDPELKKRKLEWTRNASIHAMGRVTYEQMSSYWPTSTDEYAAPMNELPKVVFSTSIERADWPTTRIARGDLADEIASLKKEFDGDILAWGGADFAQSLSRHKLVDEYRLVINPVAYGNGLPLFKDMDHAVELRLVSAQTFDTGEALHIYVPYTPAA